MSTIFPKVTKNAISLITVSHVSVRSYKVKFLCSVAAQIRLLYLRAIFT